MRSSRASSGVIDWVSPATNSEKDGPVLSLSLKVVVGRREEGSVAVGSGAAVAKVWEVVGEGRRKVREMVWRGGVCRQRNLVIVAAIADGGLAMGALDKQKLLPLTDVLFLA